MKLQLLRKLIPIIVLISLASCSEESGTIENSKRLKADEPIAKALRVKKVIQITSPTATYADTVISEFIYDRNKLIGIHFTTDNGIYDSEILYNGAKIIRINSFSQGIQTGSTQVLYNGSLLSSTISGDNQDERVDYFYINGKVSGINSYYINNGISVQSGSIQYFYESNNVIQKRRTTNFPGSVPSVINYTYDNKNNPLNGMNKYFRLLYSSEGFDGLSQNNPLTRSYYNQGNEDNVSTQTYQMEYNSHSYPTSIKRFDENNILISDTTIEYL